MHIQYLKCCIIIVARMAKEVLHVLLNNYLQILRCAWVCISSIVFMDLLKSAQPLLYNPDVLLIVSSSTAPQKLFDFEVLRKCSELDTEPGSGMTACFILLSYCAGRTL